MPVNNFTVGRDITLVFQTQSGQLAINQGITDFTCDPMYAELKSKPLNGIPQFGIVPDGWKCGFHRRRMLIPEGTRTAIRAEGERSRSVATLAFRLWPKCSASSRETCPERSGGGLLVAEKGVRGKGQQPFAPLSLAETSER